MVWSSAANSMPSSTARKIKLRRCRLISALPFSGSATVAVAAVVVIPASTQMTDLHSHIVRQARKVTAAVPGVERRRLQGGRRPRHALGEVELLAELVHQLELRLEVVDVLLFVREDLLEDVRARGVLLLAAHDDARLQPRHHLVLDGQVGLELLAQGLAHP